MLTVRFSSSATNDATGASGLSVSAQLRIVKTNYEAGEPIELLLVFTNAGPHKLRMPSADPLTFYGIKVRKEDGSAVKMTDFGVWAISADRQPGSGPPVEIAPGSAEVYSVELNRLYDLSFPQSYSVSVVREIRHPATGQSLILHTEPIKITVAPRKYWKRLAPAS
jgi:hypothetical protein